MMKTTMKCEVKKLLENIVNRATAEETTYPHIGEMIVSTIFIKSSCVDHFGQINFVHGMIYICAAYGVLNALYPMPASNVCITVS